MRYEITTYKWLKQTIASLDDDQAKGWQEYPCIHWPFAVRGRGYGVTWLNGKTVDARRIAFIEVNGPIQESSSVSSLCENDLCIRPIHMFEELDRIEYLKSVVRSLGDNVNADWREYPCIEWPFSRYELGYGLIMRGRKRYRVTRIAYEELFGCVDRSLHLLHKCDNPPCFRPSHLFTGNASENHRDMLSKGRGRSNPRRGEQHHNSRLKWEDVYAMIDMRKQGMTLEQISKAFGGYGSGNVSSILRNKMWKRS